MTVSEKNAARGSRASFGWLSVGCLVALTGFSVTAAAAPTHSAKAGASRQAPTTLPSTATRTSAARDPWIVAATPGDRAHAIAVGRRARVISRELGLYGLTEAGAVGLVADLKAADAFVYAEPDRPVRKAALPVDPLSGGQWWINPLIAPELVPPAPVATLGIVDSGADLTAPDLGDGHVTLAIGPAASSNAHGTAVTSAASASANGVGIVGLWPGLPTRMYPHGDTCSGATAGVLAAARDRVPVINMSYGLKCFSHYIATEFAFGRGSVLVAASGNSEPGGEELDFPADDPHVLTVGALAPDLSPASFTEVRNSLDVAAPGVSVPAVLPVVSDTEDGVPDGYQLVDGTSISAPLVSAAIMWVRAVRPNLTPSQVFELMRQTATDVAPAGYDTRTGFGMINLQKALVAPAPFADPQEPNDDVIWVNGRHLPKQKAVLRRAKTTSLVATLDYSEDPVDVIPVYMPPRSRLTVTAIPLAKSNVNLEVFNAAVKTVFYTNPRVPPKTLLGSSYKRGNARETVIVSNRSKKATVYYVTAFVPGNAKFSDAKYRINIRRGALTR